MRAIAESIPSQPVAGAANTKPLWVAVGVLSLAVLGMGGVLIHGQANTPAVANPVATTATAAEPTKIEAPAERAVKSPAAAATKTRPSAAVVAKAGGPTDAAPSSGGGYGSEPVATAAGGGQAPVVVQAPVQPVCGNCGWVESVQQVQQAGHPVGVGAVAGGVLGAVVGHQMGGGTGRTVATVLGAVGGGLAGNEVEKRLKKSSHYEVRVRMEDGSLRTFEQANPLAHGDHVVVENGVLRPAPQPVAPTNGMPSVTGKVYSTQ